ncbi:MAG: hypothetical protein LQ349_006860, partial [Xanthoria aureola]
MDTELSPPPLGYGKRLLPSYIDEIARDDPNRTFALIPRSTSVEAGYNSISFHQLSQAIDRCAWWIETTLGRSFDFTTLAYIGPLDLLYHILTLAAAFLLSHRNSVEAHVALLGTVQCQILLVPENESLTVSRVLDRRTVQKIRIPGIEHFLQDGEVAPYAYEKTFDEARLAPFAVLQTSGSTGIPKPVTVSHGTLASMDAFHLISYLGGDAIIGPSLRGTKMLMAFPLYHMASFTLLLGYAVYYGVIGVLPPAVEPITARLIDAIHTQTNVQGSALPPSVLVDLYHESSYLDRLAQLQYIFYAGGSLPNEAGDKISSITKLSTLVGSTEIGYPPMKVLESNDWQYVCYSPFDGHVFRPLADDGLYEHILVRRDYLDPFQSIFSTYPDLDEFSTQDIYRRHPTKPNLWRFWGRMDDVIVFSNAEKFYPGDFEDSISSHPAVRTVLMGGHGEFQSCLLIEPMTVVNSLEGRTALLEEIWPKVQEANGKVVAFARVIKDFIIFTNDDKPMERTGKGTVQRTDTLRLYKDEIIKLFNTPEIPKIDPRQVVPPEIDQGSTLRKVLNELVSTSVEHDGEIDDQTDFFDLGLDSLQALALSKKINAHLMQKSPVPLTVTPNTIYTHSNVDGLTAVLEPTHSSSPAKENDEEKMQQIFSRCSSSLPQASGGRTRRKGQAVVVLLTGSTGSLGSYILDALIQDPRIDKIYCCNRGYDAQTKQTKSSQAKGLSFDWQKVKFIQYDLGKPRLGLVGSDPSYDALSQEVTHVIHNAWDVNFKRSLDSFVNVHLRGVSELIHFCTGAQPAARLTFISSESAVLGGSAGSIAKEEIIHDWSRAQKMGYAQSKLIAERIIDQASLPGSTIIRVGQIAGPTDGKGVWNSHEWFPSLINSSAHMRKLPDTLPMKKDVDWVPLDIV